MSRNPWPAKAASVIILPSGERGQVLHAMAKSWSQSGILGQALWIMPKDDLNKSHDLAIEASVQAAADLPQTFARFHARCALHHGHQR